MNTRFNYTIILCTLRDSISPCIQKFQYLQPKHSSTSFILHKRKYFFITLFYTKRLGFLLEEGVPIIHAITKCTEILTVGRSHSLIHQSDLYFTSKFAIFLGFRVIVISNHAHTLFFITMFQIMMAQWSVQCLASPCSYTNI